MLCLGTVLLSADHSEIVVDLVFLPFSGECFQRGLGNNDHIGFGIAFGQDFFHSWERRNTVDHFSNVFVYFETPVKYHPELFAAGGGDFGFQSRVAKFAFLFNPGVKFAQYRDGNTACREFFALANQFNGALNREETVATAGFAVKIDEFPYFTRILAGSLHPEVFDKIRAEAFFLLDFHSVENTTVTVESDEELMFLRQILHLCNIIHSVLLHFLWLLTFMLSLAYFVKSLN